MVTTCSCDSFCVAQGLLSERVAVTAGGDKWVLGGLAVLYNPIVSVHLGDKELWSILNIATVIYFWVVRMRWRRT